MKTIVINTIKELKNQDWSNVKSINGYELKSLTPDVTSKHCYIYDVETQGNKYFSAPFELILK